MFAGTSFEHYVLVLKRKIWLILFVVVLCTGITLFANLSMVPSYESSALVQVHDTSTSNNSVFTDQALAVSYALVITSGNVLQAAAKELPGVTPAELANQVTDSPLDNTQIIEVRATAKSGAEAANIANVVANTFVQTETTTLTTRLRSQALTLNKEVISAKTTLDTDQAQLNTLETAQPRATQDQINHQNDVIINDQSSYSALQTSYNNVEQQLLQVPGTLSVTQQAMPASTPTSPKTSVNTLIAAALSLLLMIVLALVLDWMDTTLKTPDDIEHLAQMIPLGSLPFCKNETLPKGIPSAGAPLIGLDPIDQAFVGISTTVSMVGQGTRSLLVTSLHKQAGTSTVAANLAISLARAGIRVLLIDANLKKPSLHTAFQFANTRGLTTTLSDSTMLQDASNAQIMTWLQQWNTRVPNLWFLPTGPNSGQPGTILRSPVMNVMLKNLLQIEQGPGEIITPSPIEVVIFDAPPLEESSDTLALAAYTEASLLVIEAGKEQPHLLQKAQTVLNRLESPLLGAVINKQLEHQHSYFYANRFRVEEVSNGEIASFNNQLRLNTAGYTGNIAAISILSQQQNKANLPEKQTKLPITPTFANGNPAHRNLVPAAKTSPAGSENGTSNGVTKG